MFALKLRCVLCLFVAVATGYSTLSTSSAADAVNWEEEPIRYSQREPTRNAIARLQAGMNTGDVVLEHRGEHGYLAGLLEKLKIPISSQVLVFSKTSLQDDKIAPRQPRAIYFNDTTHVGYVQGGLIEIAVADPDLGMVFYTLDPDKSDKPQMFRQANRCLSCHGAARTKGVPGLLVRSVYPDANGQPIVKAGSFLSSHRSPFEQRWGGWYVTGTHGELTHLGNYVLKDGVKPKVFSNQAGMNLTGLHAHIDTDHYLAESSDMVALLTLEHQVEAYNLLTQANFVAQHTLWQARQRDSVGEPMLDHAGKERIRQAVQPLVKYLAFQQEAKLNTRIVGTSSFRSDFEALHSNVSSTVGRFKLEERLFEVPLSYLLYSDVFSQLSPALHAAIQEELLKAIASNAPSTVEESVTKVLKEQPPPWFYGDSKVAP